jgi:putative radical SAM enzyme (TIGR03279 family)
MPAGKEETKVNHEHSIVDVIPGSPAYKAGLRRGDRLLRMNGRDVIDVLDFRFEEEETRLSLTFLRDGAESEVTIHKGECEELGLVFAESLMDDYRSCRNDCVFCFINQMPPGMRETLYFKDDDTRLSFLQGNYVTLTNVSDEELERICFYKLSPMNISVHTTNPELRCKMLHNRFAGEIIRKMRRLKEAGITMNGQIVLVPEYNDGAELERTIHDLTEFLPNLQSLSVVPVGLTKYRDHLPKIRTFTKEESREVIGIIAKWQKICLRYFDTRFVYASDEWFLTADLPLPSEDEYEGYPQIENGVGMVRSLTEEVEWELEDREGDDRVHEATIATGVLIAPTIEKLCRRVCEVYPNLHVAVVPIINHFFGETITVSGLLTGKDIIEQLSGREIRGKLILPENLLRSGEDVLLDDKTVSDIENALQTRVRIVKSEGYDFVESLVEEGNEEQL